MNQPIADKIRKPTGSSSRSTKKRLSILINIITSIIIEPYTFFASIIITTAPTEKKKPVKELFPSK
jgi:hypothetical protein